MGLLILPVYRSTSLFHTIPVWNGNLYLLALYTLTLILSVSPGKMATKVKLRVR